MGGLGDSDIPAPAGRSTLGGDALHVSGLARTSSLAGGMRDCWLLDGDERPDKESPLLKRMHVPKQSANGHGTDAA